MRCLLTIIIIFFITNVSFASKPAVTPPAYHSVKAKHCTAQLFHNIPAEEGSSLNQDEFDHPTLIQQLLKKQFISSIQLFNRLEYKLTARCSLITYAIKSELNTDFIYHLLYPKHFFW